MQSGGASTAALRAVRRQSLSHAARRPQRRWWASAPKIVAEIGFGYLAAFCDFGAIALAAAGAGSLYKILTFGLLPNVEPVTEIGLIVGVLVVLFNIQRSDY